MRLIKNKLAFLLFLFILACGQNTERQARNSNNDTPLNQMSEMETQVVKNNDKTEEADENSVSNDSIEDKKVQTQNETDIEPAGDNESTVQSSGWDRWMIVAIASLGFNVLILSLLVYVIGRKKYHTKRKEHYKGRKEYYKNKFQDLEKTINQRRSQKVVSPRKPIREINDKKTQRKSPTIKEPILDEERSVEVNLSVNPVASSVEQNEDSKMIDLFAEKATDDKIFTSVSDQKNEYKSIYRLILDDINSEKAEFEVVDSDYILKMAVNSPDTYLYPVCKPENSNQNYSGEIITTKRGIARKVDGKWKVNEEDKATIKFQ